MDSKDCLQILKNIKSLAFATVDENGLPQVRIIDLMLIEDEKLYFLTAKGKSFYKQLIDSENVAITGMNDNWQTIRLQGKAKKVDDQKLWLDKMFQANPSMEKMYPGESRDILEGFVIDAGELELFDLSDVPINREYHAFGGAEPKPKGFVIAGGCNKCSRCASNCPQQCIVLNSHYKIEQEKCLHCGLCFRRCPMKAIKKIG